MDELQIHGIDDSESLELDYFEESIQAGFPSPVQGSMGDIIDLNRELVNNAAATFCARVIGESMTGVGINPGDLLIIDRSIEPHDGCVAVCFIDGEYTVKRIAVRSDGVYLLPSNKRFPEIRVSSESNFTIWGIVTHVIKKMN